MCTAPLIPLTIARLPSKFSRMNFWEMKNLSAGLKMNPKQLLFCHIRTLSRCMTSALAIAFNILWKNILMGLRSRITSASSVKSSGRKLFILPFRFFVPFSMRTKKELSIAILNHRISCCCRMEPLRLQISALPVFRAVKPVL